MATKGAVLKPEHISLEFFDFDRIISLDFFDLLLLVLLT